MIGTFLATAGLALLTGNDQRDSRYRRAWNGHWILCANQSPSRLIAQPNRAYIVLEPVFGGFFGYVLAGDRLTITNWIGAALIVAGMLVAETQFNRPPPREESRPQPHAS